MVNTPALREILLLVPSANNKVDLVLRGMDKMRCCEIKSCDTKSPVAPQSTNAVPRIPLILTLNFSNRIDVGNCCPNILHVYITEDEGPVSGRERLIE